MALNLAALCAIQGQFHLPAVVFSLIFLETGAVDYQELWQADSNAVVLGLLSSFSSLLASSPVVVAAGCVVLLAATKSFLSVLHQPHLAKPAEAERHFAQDIAFVLSGSRLDLLIRFADVCVALFLVTSLVGPFVTVSLVVISLFKYFANHDCFATTFASLVCVLFCCILSPIFPPLLALAYSLLRLTILHQLRVACVTQLWSLGHYAFTLRLMFAFGYDRDLCYHVRDNGLLWAAFRRGLQNTKSRFSLLGRPFQRLLQPDAFTHCGADAVPCFDGEPWSNWAETVKCTPSRTFLPRCAEDVVKVCNTAHTLGQKHTRAHPLRLSRALASRASVCGVLVSSTRGARSRRLRTTSSTCACCAM